MKTKLTYRYENISYTTGGGDKSLIVIPADSFDDYTVEVIKTGGPATNIDGHYYSENLLLIKTVTKTFPAVFTPTDGDAYFIVLIPDGDGIFTVNIATLTRPPL